MTTTVRSDASGTFGALQVNGTDVLRFGADTSGALAGFRNILINGEVTRINQRAVANWAAVSNGAYGYDRWKKIDASNMTQIVEAGNFVPSTTYTLSGIGVTTQQLVSPASGNWTLPNIPIAATYVQLERGSIATPFENRSIGLELSLCQLYYQKIWPTYFGQASSSTAVRFYAQWLATMRTAPTIVIANGTGIFDEIGVAVRNLSGLTLTNATINGGLLDGVTAGTTTNNRCAFNGSLPVELSAEL